MLSSMARDNFFLSCFQFKHPTMRSFSPLLMYAIRGIALLASMNKLLGRDRLPSDSNQWMRALLMVAENQDTVPDKQNSPKKIWQLPSLSKVDAPLDEYQANENLSMVCRLIRDQPGFFVAMAVKGDLVPPMVDNL